MGRARIQVEGSIDVQAFARIIGTAGSFAPGSEQQRAFVLRSALEMLRAKAVALFHQASPGEPLTFALLGVEGWLTQKEAAIFQHMVATHTYRANPFLMQFAQMPDEKACPRRAMVSDSEWYSCEHVQNTYRELDIDEFLLARSSTRHPDQVYLAFARPWSDRYRFHERDAAVAHIFAAALAPMMGSTPSGPDVPQTRSATAALPIPELPRRLHQVYLLLVAGIQEKEIATRLGISARTAHHHTTRLYRRMNVTSRAQLLASHAKWVRPGLRDREGLEDDGSQH